MKTTVELKERNRITVPVHVVQGLALKPGDFLELTIEVIKRGAK
jgi:bifunctional DNA-binding transcriptional regulator/antitoxin component of YhaV-PrlF toxin-antitoxin module